jgi:uncharacterized protein YecT (DUF1311 family)
MNISRTKSLVFVGLAVISTFIQSPAWSASCGSLTDDVEVVACAQQELQAQIDSLQSIYGKLAEALGPKAAADLPGDQTQWLQRVSTHCGISAVGDLSSIASSGLNTAQLLCLKRFVEVRGRDLGGRIHRASEIAKAFADKDYPAVSQTWGDRLNPNGKIPIGRFAAFYLRSGNPPTLVATDTVDEVSLNYPWADFHGIKSEDFEGYWVGRFRYAKETLAYIAVDQSWSRTRVIVDRKLVYEGGSNARVPYTFSAGMHTIEVEYINNWHTTGISVALTQAVEPIGPGELRNQLRALAPENTAVYLAAAYESGARDNVIKLKLAPSPVPIVLLLSSYSAVRWDISNPHKVDLRAIVYGSYAPGSRIQTEQRDSAVPRIPVQGQIGSHDAAPRCSCVGGLFHCEGSHFGNSVQTVSSLLGLPVTGFSGKYSPQTLDVPDIVVTPEVLEDAKSTLERLGRERNECQQTSRFK